MKFQRIFLLVFFVITNIAAQDFKSEHFTIEKLSDGVFAVIHKAGGYAICNAGIVNLGDETLVYDCFISPLAAKDLKTAAEKLTGNKVKYLVNSHFHNDHIRGNQIFTDAEIIATERIKDLIEMNEPEELKSETEIVGPMIEKTLKQIEKENDPDMLEEHKMWLDYYKAIQQSLDEYKITLPNKFFTDTLVIKGSKRNAAIINLGKGHTEEDIVLWLPEEKILFGGDLMFSERHPFLGDGFPNEWINCLEKFKKLDAKYIVPGHGNVGSNEDIDKLKLYIQKVENIIDNAIADNLTIDQLKQTEIPDEFKSWRLSRFYMLNLIIGYQKKVGANK